LGSKAGKETGKGSFTVSQDFQKVDWLFDQKRRAAPPVLRSARSDESHREPDDRGKLSRRTHALRSSHSNTQARLRFNTAAAFVRFSLDGKKLFVLTASQPTLSIGPPEQTRLNLSR
jgi:hypothetical protein